MKTHLSIFGTAFFITLAIFLVGILLSFGLDSLRYKDLSLQTREQEILSQSFIVQQDFFFTFNETNCNALQDEIMLQKKDLSELGADLSNYGKKALSKKKDFDYLKRKYFLLEMNMLITLNKYNDECGKYYEPLIFFYTIDKEDSLKQGFILDELSKDDNKYIILSFDNEYEDEPLLVSIKNSYNISKTPTIIILNKHKKLEGLKYLYEIKEELE